ncbi:MAG: hypothetical protein EOO52_00225 [Gammaproteobacteria bacterium]|nr:MAG: hypothetical protein EOO52_00225 [Gammaproteobacteria bacterium]
MNKHLGLTRFEFFFVMSAIGILMLVALGRYQALAEETRRVSFEVIVNNFSAAIYNHHARWITAQQSQQDGSSLVIDGHHIYFSPTGWPIAALVENNIVNPLSITTCLSLWQHLLQNPPLISFTGGDAYGTQKYHLSLIENKICRYEYVSDPPQKLFLDYQPTNGKIVFQK